MNNRALQKYWLIAVLVVIFASCVNSPGKIITVWLIGDSTVADYTQYSNYQAERFPKTGWGQVFQPLMTGESLEDLEGLSDNTHFQPEGAKEVAHLVFSAMRELAEKEESKGTNK